MPARPTRLLLAGIGATVAVAVAAPASAATTPTQVGLFGSQDPKYDGTYRQGLALLALSAAGVTPDAAAVGWLTKRECANGSWSAFRADPATACAAGSGDSNATGLAVQALAALGKPVTAGVTALKTFQLSDGGFYSNTAYGAPASDANSTGIALSALAAAGVDPATVTSGGKTGFDYLKTLQLGCSAAASDQGAYDFQSESPLYANDYATVQADLGMQGKALPVAPASGSSAEPTLDCSGTPPTEPTALTNAQSADAAAGYLARKLAANGDHIPPSFGSSPDYTSTANAVLALVADGVGSGQVTAATDYLAAHVDAYVKDSKGADQAGPLATLILTAHATGRDPHAFGGSDLVARLLAIETKAPAAAATPTPTAAPSTATATPSVAATAAQPTLPNTGAGQVALLGLGGVVLVAVGTGLLVAGRRRHDGVARP